MKKTLYIGILSLCCVLLLSACMRKTVVGRGNVVSNTRTVTAFTGIDLSFPVDVEVIVNPSAQPAVELIGYENILPYIKTDVKDNTLRVYGDEKVNIEYDEEHVSVRITVPSLSALGVSGASAANVQGTITGQKFSLEVSGAGEITIAELRVADFSADLSGASNITIHGGTVVSANYELSGAGDVKAFGLASQNVSADVSGMGNMELSVSQKLHAEISGAGEIKYRGNASVESDISGAGKVTKVD